jgi:hypothetical protein
VASAGQSAALRIGEPEPASHELLLEDAVLFPKILDDLQLVPIHPTCQATSRICQGTTSTMRRVYRQAILASGIVTSAEFPDSTASNPSP